MKDLATPTAAGMITEAAAEAGTSSSQPCQRIQTAATTFTSLLRRC